MVSIEKIPDGEGTTITLGVIGGSYTVPWPSIADQSERVLHLKLNPNDVILTGYPKSGTHWVWEILNMLLKGKAEPAKSTKEMLMFSFGTQKDFDKFPSPRIFNSHADYDGMPRSLRPNTRHTKIIHLLRNPKDVAVSFYHHLRCAKDFEYHGTWNGFYKLFIEGKVPGELWFDYVLKWEKAIAESTDCPILTVFYEDLQKDCSYQIKRMSEFLGLEYSQELYEAIAEKCRFQNMKENDQILKEQYKIHTSADGNNFIFRKGVVGDWKNYFTVAQNEEFDQILEKKMCGSKIKFTYSLDEDGVK